MTERAAGRAAPAASQAPAAAQAAPWALPAQEPLATASSATSMQVDSEGGGVSALLGGPTSYPATAAGGRRPDLVLPSSHMSPAPLRGYQLPASYPAAAAGSPYSPSGGQEGWGHYRMVPPPVASPTCYPTALPVPGRGQAAAAAAAAGGMCSSGTSQQQQQQPRSPSALNPFALPFVTGGPAPPTGLGYTPHLAGPFWPGYQTPAGPAGAPAAAAAAACGGGASPQGLPTTGAPQQQAFVTGGGNWTGGPPNRRARRARRWGGGGAAAGVGRGKKGGGAKGRGKGMAAGVRGQGVSGSSLHQQRGCSCASSALQAARSSLQQPGGRRRRCGAACVGWRGRCQRLPRPAGT
jgi:hypothetical protein